MGWSLSFSHKISYQDPDYFAPIVVGLIRRNGAEQRMKLWLDTGAQYTLVRGSELEPLGFSPPDMAEIQKAQARGQLSDLGCMRFKSTLGDEAYGYGFEVTLSIEGGPEKDFLIYGSVDFDISRNLLGRDFFQTVVLGLHHYDEAIYLE